MTNFSKTLSVIVLLICANLAFAQSISFKVGINSSNQIWKDNDETFSDDGDFKILLGGNCGGVIEWPVYNNFSVESGLLFSTKGYKIKTSNESSKYVERNYLLYIDLPANVKYSHNFGKLNLFAAAGPYLAYGFYGKMYGKETSNGDVGKIESRYRWGNKFSDDLKPFDFGVGFSGGVKLGLFIYAINYQVGLRNLATADINGAQIKNRVLSISVGINFKFKQHSKK